MDVPSSSFAGLLTSLLIFFLILVYAFVSIRIYIRTQKTKNFGAADVCLLISVILTTTFTLLTILSTTNGIGTQPSSLLPPATLSLGLHYHFLATLLFLLSSTTLRIAASLHLLSLACTTKTQRCTIQSFITATTAFCTWYFLLILLQCMPVSYYWESLLQGFSGGCLDPASLGRQGFVYAVVSGVSDIALGAGGVWCLWGAKLGRREKYGVVGCVAGACLAGTAAMLRIPATAMLVKTNEFFYDTVSLLTCSILELGIGSVTFAAAGFQIKKATPKPSPDSDSEKGKGDGDKKDSGAKKEQEEQKLFCGKKEEITRKAIPEQSK